MRIWFMDKRGKGFHESLHSSGLKDAIGDTTHPLDQPAMVFAGFRNSFDTVLEGSYWHELVLVS